MGIKEDITKTVGGTPLVDLKRFSRDLDARILAKLESFNPLSSVKDRIGISMIEDAEKDGLLKEGSLIIEPTSGNTGIALAFTCASKGYRLILTMPETMSMERRKLLKILGAEVVLTDGSSGMKGAIEKAIDIQSKNKGSFMPQQFKNPANPEIHRRTTAPEIWQDCKGKIDIFIAGVGTGGTITGVGEFLKSKDKLIRIVAVEPFESPVLSGGKPGAHDIQGIGAGFIPDVLNTGIIDEIVKIKSHQAKEAARRIAREEGILAGISGGAALSAALEIAKKDSSKGKTIVVLLPDSGERYLSTWLYG